MNRMNASVEFAARKAPYAPISSLEQFFERIRDRSTPERIDHRFLRKLNVASNNEYALLSALKFLGIIDDRGFPAHPYKQLQTTDRFQETLRHLVETAYGPLFDMGAETWPLDDLINFFRVSSSPSQAKNAARFFRAVCRLAGIGPRRLPGAVSLSEHDPQPGEDTRPAATLVQAVESGDSGRTAAPGPESRSEAAPSSDLLQARARLLEKLPMYQPGWSAAEYEQICSRFVEMLRFLD